jgi:hypothetical protein
MKNIQLNKQQSYWLHKIDHLVTTEFPRPKLIPYLADIVGKVVEMELKGQSTLQDTVNAFEALYLETRKKLMIMNELPENFQDER